MFCAFLRRPRWGIGLFLKVIPLKPILDHARLQKSQECLTVTNPVMRIYSNGQLNWLHVKCPLPPMQPRNVRGSIIYFTIIARQRARAGNSAICYRKINKLTSGFYASVLLLIMNFVITLSK